MTQTTDRPMLIDSRDSFAWIAGRLSLLRTAGRAHDVDLQGIEDEARRMAKALHDHLANTTTTPALDLNERARILDISQEAAALIANLSIEEARTQTCDDCGTVILIHQDAAWRFRMHQIRCSACIQRAEAAGVTRFDAAYVT